jgi:hypothetical protein
MPASHSANVGSIQFSRSERFSQIPAALPDIAFLDLRSTRCRGSSLVTLKGNLRPYWVTLKLCGQTSCSGTVDGPLGKGEVDPSSGKHTIGHRLIVFKAVESGSGSPLSLWAFDRWMSLEVFNQTSASWGEPSPSFSPFSWATIQNGFYREKDMMHLFKALRLTN